MSINGKTLGIIGGMGPLATAYLAEKLALHSDLPTDQEHIDLLIHSHPSTPDRTSYILGRSKESPLPKILETGKSLCECGADLIAIPCVTSHYFYEEISSALCVPVVNMAEETAKEASRLGVEQVGIMATTGTVQTRVLQNQFLKYNIQSVLPSDKTQEKVMYLIYDCVKAGKPLDRKCFHEVCAELYEGGAQKIILGCTELSVVNTFEHTEKDTICALDVLAKTCLQRLSIPVK